MRRTPAFSTRHRPKNPHLQDNPPTNRLVRNVETIVPWEVPSLIPPESKTGRNGSEKVARNRCSTLIPSTAKPTFSEQVTHLRNSGKAQAAVSQPTPLPAFAYEQVDLHPQNFGRRMLIVSERSAKLKKQTDGTANPQTFQPSTTVEV